MFPLKSLIALSRIPFLTYLLILVNIFLFIYTTYIAPSPLVWVDFGLVPSKLGMPEGVIPFYEKVYPFITYTFLHGSWWHLLWNIYFLYIFGGGVEDKIGRLRLFAAYVFFGIMAGIMQVLYMPTSSYPIIGASGAVAGIMGAYIVLYPAAKIKAVIIILILILVRDIPAFIFIGLWFILQLASGLFEMSYHGGVAWWAHIGGFAAGVAAGAVFRVNGILMRRNERRNLHSSTDT